MRYLTLILFLSLAACQMKPTQVMEESVNAFAENTVLVDTRSAFEYASFHIQGSINLSSGDFLILKNPLTQRRILDPDLKQTIERLAHRGITPNKRILLLSNQAGNEENKKWQWLLKNLEIEDVRLMSMNDFRKAYPNRQFALPSREAAWDIKTSEELQNEFIFKKAPECFVKWSESKCQKTF
ncbi:MAG: hypothetical protein H7061_09745 [Bdellovibrionaceae bacterium]|nr:hypothetical protein [Bdellovibrio sp.]